LDIEALYWSDRPRARSEALTWLDHLGPNPVGPTPHRLGLVVASVDHLQGDATHGATQAQQSLDWAVAQGDLGLQARCHRFLSAVFRRVGESGLSLEHAVSANDLLDDSESPSVHAAARLCLGDALGGAGSYDESQRRYREALNLIGDDDLPVLRLAILNNSAFTYHVAHRANEALGAVDLLLRTSAAHHLSLGMSERDTVARVLVVAGRIVEAERVLAPAMEPLTDHDNPEGFAMGNVTLAEVCRRQGALDRAQAAIDRGLALCRRHGLAQATVEFAREQAELFAAGESYQLAFEKFREYHARSAALSSDRQDARGRVFEAVFRTAEAREESSRYRELAERDPLTGLYNRRYIDEQLAQRLTTVFDGESSLAVSMIDIDNFKLINDLHSHQVGDEVLRALGHILREFAASVPGGVAARMGGEEFLLIVPGIDAGAAAAAMDSVRRAISERDWQSLADGLAVTASIGVAIAPLDGVEGSKLLHTADARLYLAKEQGRNRCVLSGAPETKSMTCATAGEGSLTGRPA
jgi:diguanylate cyclase (GGDEF)-like protein